MSIGTLKSFVNKDFGTVTSYVFWLFFLPQFEFLASQRGANQKKTNEIV